MSRRKQANPKSLKHAEEGGGEEETASSLSSRAEMANASESCTDMSQASDSQPNSTAPTSADEYQEFDEDLRPLVIDTTNTREQSLASSSSCCSPSNPDLTQAQQDDPTMGMAHELNSTHSTSDTSMITSLKEYEVAPQQLADMLGTNIKPVKHSSPSKTRRKSDKILPIANMDGGERYICPVCHLVLPNNHELTRHIRTHNIHGSTGPVSSPNTCTICGKILSSQSSLDRHMLVHSGERPFKCKICMMSFTTNGNMHRHTRIHEKEDMANGASPSLPPRAESAGLAKTPRVRKRPQTYENGMDVGATRPRSAKRKKASSDVEDGSPAKGYTARPDGYGKDVVSSISSLMNSSTNDMMSSFLPSSPSNYSPKVPEHKRVAGDGEVVAHCSLCSVTFQSTRGLHMHKLLVHMQSDKRGIEPILSTTISNNTTGSPSKMTVGFCDLDFLDFTSDNFSLVAKSWCERNVRQASSEFHKFVCKLCPRAFPCGSALKMHMNTHPPNHASCTICKTTFQDRDRFCDHLLQHAQHKVIDRYVNTQGVQDNDMQDIVRKEEFMLVMGLKIKPSSNKLQPLKTVTESSTAVISTQDARKVTDYSTILESLKVVNNSSQPSPLLPSSRLTGSSQQYSSAKPSQSLPGASTNHLTVFHARQPSVNLNYKGDHATVTPVRGFSSHMKTTPAESPAYKGMMIKQEYISDSQDMGVDEASRPSPSTKTMLDIPVPVREAQEKDMGMFNCKCCDEVFSNYRAYKAHSRSHKGLSPYKCNQCPYSSTDKSTLIRHLRTHNGERPYQCRICDFPFTTKANCERHVRKKHFLDDKDHVERAIHCMDQQQGLDTSSNNSNDSLSQYTAELIPCQHCGEEFKNLHALREHQRVSSECCVKPYMCRLCSKSFVSRANSLRHVLHQHPEIEPAAAERMTLVNDTLLQEKLVMDSPDSRRSSPVHGKSHIGSGPPQNAHSRSSDSWVVAPPPALITGPVPPRARSGHSALVHQPQAVRPRPQQPYIITPPVPAVIKAEAQDVQEEQPLDFSMKSQNQTREHVKPRYVPQISPVILNDDNDEQPMDLTVSKRAALPAHHPSPPPAATVQRNTSRLGAILNHQSTSSTRSPPSRVQSAHPNVSRREASVVEQRLRAYPVMVPTPVFPLPPLGLDYGMPPFASQPLSFFNPVEGKFQCPYCGALFEHGLKLLVHIQSHNQLPNRADAKQAPFLQRESWRLKQSKDNHVITSKHSKFDNRHDDKLEKDFLTEQNNNNTSEPCGRECSVSMAKTKASPERNNSDCELASVTNMLNTANADNFRAFLNHNNITEIKPDEDEEERLTPVQDSLIEEAEMEHDEHEEHEEHDDSSALIGDNTKTELTSGDTGSGTKRKRNSYSDSPHKLRCQYCPRAFPWISSLKRHLLTHTGQKPFRCPQCPVTFSTKSNRERHMIRKHGLNVHDPATRQMMDRPYKCHLCVFSSFATSANLKKHYAEKHPGKEIPDSVMQLPEDCEGFEPGEFQDNISEMSEGRGSSLMDGEEDMYEEELCMIAPSTSPCPPDGLGSRLADQSPYTPCSTPDGPSTTPDRQLAQPHVNPERDNYNVDKIVECWKCNEVFESRKVLLRHLKEHNIDLPFKCYLCDASFELRKESVDHVVEHHASDWVTLKEKNKVTTVEEFVQTMDVIVEQTLLGTLDNSQRVEALTRMQLEELKPESDYAQRKVYCTLCPKRFWSLQDLRRHMRSHTGERPFECPVCHKRFTLKHSMMRHQRKHGDLPTAANLSDDETSLLAAAAAESVMSSGSRPASANSAFQVVNSNRSSPTTWAVNNSKDSTISHTTMTTTAAVTVARPANKVAHVVKVKATGASDLLNSDILQNLLGVEGSALDEMLGTSADNAAKLLGVGH